MFKLSFGCYFANSVGEQNLITHTQGLLFAISKNSVAQIWRSRFSKDCIKIDMFRLSLATISQ